MNQRENREETVFHAALELATDQRTAYVALACGDDEALRHRVEILLQAEAEAKPFFAKGPVQVVLGEQPRATACNTPPRTLKSELNSFTLGTGVIPGSPRIT
jgi:hypothetical protein